MMRRQLRTMSTIHTPDAGLRSLRPPPIDRSERGGRRPALVAEAGHAEPPHIDGIFRSADASPAMHGNQIVDYFRALPEAEGTAGAADHLRRYWASKMRAEIGALAKTDGAGLNPSPRARSRNSKPRAEA
jgi:hypothetical protein